MYPGDLGIGHAKVLCNLGDGQRDGEEVEGIPHPAQEASQEHKPLVPIEFPKYDDWGPNLCLQDLSSEKRALKRVIPTRGGLRLVGRVRR